MTGRRIGEVSRVTGETEIEVVVDLDRAAEPEISTGLGFFDHMLCALAKHSGIGVRLSCRGDLHVDDHHTIEDCALALGAAVNRALGERRGVARFGHAYAPLDEALARVVIDLSGRAHAEVDLPFARDAIGDVATENLPHFFGSFASAARCTLHVDLVRGRNDHHRAEAAFKAFALALRAAVALREGETGVPSTKGVL